MLYKSHGHEKRGKGSRERERRARGEKERSGRRLGRQAGRVETLSLALVLAVLALSTSQLRGHLRRYGLNVFFFYFIALPFFFLSCFSLYTAGFAGRFASKSSEKSTWSWASSTNSLVSAHARLCLHEAIVACKAPCNQLADQSSPVARQRCFFFEYTYTFDIDKSTTAVAER
ncbi:hypothetical protein BDV19DRAFT_45345 [Aspergillus venezuelensis]